MSEATNADSYVLSIVIPCYNEVRTIRQVVDANRVLTVISDIITNTNLTDMMTGYKAFKREAIQGVDICENGFGCEAEGATHAFKVREDLVRNGSGSMKNSAQC
jgi:hypothetical protein